MSIRASAAAIVRQYYSVSLVYSLASGFLVGVYPLFLRSRGLTQFEINSVLAVYFIVTVFTDVPTGAFADALGRRRAFVLGCFIRGVAFAVYFVSHTYVLFLVAEAIDAIGTTFCNGAVDAWGVDALDAEGFEGAKDRLFSRISQLSTVGVMTTAIIGGAVGSLDLAWPWLLGATGFIVSGLVGTTLQERRQPIRHLDLAAVRATLTIRIGNGLRQGIGVRSVRLLSLAEAIILGAYASYWLEWPLLFKDSYGVGVWIVGWIFCALSLANMLGAEIVARTTLRPRHRARALSGLMIAAGLLLIGAGMLAGRPTHALVMLCLMNVCLGAQRPLALSWFNEQLAPDDRATMLSFRGTLATAGAALGLLFGGLVADVGGIPFRWKVGGVLALFAVPCYQALQSPARKRLPS